MNTRIAIIVVMFISIHWVLRIDGLTSGDLPVWACYLALGVNCFVIAILWMNLGASR